MWDSHRWVRPSPDAGCANLRGSAAEVQRRNEEACLESCSFSSAKNVVCRHGAAIAHEWDFQPPPPR